MTSIDKAGRDLLDAESDKSRLSHLGLGIDLAILDQLTARHLGQVFTFKQQCNGDMI